MAKSCSATVCPSPYRAIVEKRADSWSSSTESFPRSTIRSRCHDRCAAVSSPERARGREQRTHCEFDRVPSIVGHYLGILWAILGTLIGVCADWTGVRAVLACSPHTVGPLTVRSCFLVARERELVSRIIHRVQRRDLRRPCLEGREASGPAGSTAGEIHVRAPLQAKGNSFGEWRNFRLTYRIKRQIANQRHSS
jgi:hypothetical protein